MSVGKSAARAFLQVYASDSVTLQELNFQKRSILKQMQKAHPESNVTDLALQDSVVASGQ